VREIAAYEECKDSNKREIVRGTIIPGNVYDIEKKGKEKKSEYKPTHTQGMVVDREKE
jgi:hypothetical protein